MNDAADISEVQNFKIAQMACIIAESDTKIVEGWCLNAKKHRESILNNFLVRLRVKLSKKADELDSQKRS